MTKQGDEQHALGVAEGWSRCRWVNVAGEQCEWLISPDWTAASFAWGELWTDTITRNWVHRHNTEAGAKSLQARSEFQAMAAQEFGTALAAAAATWAADPSADTERGLLEELVRQVASLAGSGSAAGRLKALELLSSGLNAFRRAVPPPPPTPINIALSPGVMARLMEDLQGAFSLVDVETGETVFKAPEQGEWDKVWRGRCGRMPQSRIKATESQVAFYRRVP